MDLQGEGSWCSTKTRKIGVSLSLSWFIHVRLGRLGGLTRSTVGANVTPHLRSRKEPPRRRNTSKDPGPGTKTRAPYFSRLVPSGPRTILCLSISRSHHCLSFSPHPRLFLSLSSHLAGVAALEARLQRRATPQKTLPTSSNITVPGLGRQTHVPAVQSPLSCEIPSKRGAVPLCCVRACAYVFGEGQPGPTIRFCIKSSLSLLKGSPGFGSCGWILPLMSYQRPMKDRAPRQAFGLPARRVPNLSPPPPQHRGLPAIRGTALHCTAPSIINTNVNNGRERQEKAKKRFVQAYQ